MGRLIPFASLPLRIIPPGKRQGITELIFRTIPSATKVEIQRYLEAVYDLPVERVSTANYEGKKKRSRYGFYRRPDWKKAWVTLREPIDLPDGLYLGPNNPSDSKEGATSGQQ